MIRDALIHLRETLNLRLFNLAGTTVTTMTIITFVLILLFGFLLSRVIQKAIDRALKARGVEDAGTIGVANRLVHYTVLTVVLAIGLQTVGIKLSALFAAGAVFAVAIGFAMQEVVKNFVSGMILLVERTIKPNDVLEVGGQMVKVVKLGIRATVARTRDEEDVIIPNSKLVQDTVKNHTFKDKVRRICVNVGVTYHSDMKQVREILESVVRGFKERSDVEDPLVILHDFGSSSVDWKVFFWTQDPWKDYVLRCRLREEIWHRLQDEGVVIAFPQVDVHFDPPVTEAVSRFGKAA